MALKMTNLNFL